MAYYKTTNGLIVKVSGETDMLKGAEKMPDDFVSSENKEEKKTKKSKK